MRFDVIWCKKMYCDLFWCFVMQWDLICLMWVDVMCHDAMRCNVICSGLMWCDAVRCDLFWCALMQWDVMRFVLVWCDAMRCYVFGVMRCNEMRFVLMWCNEMRFALMCFDAMRCNVICSGVSWCDVRWCNEMKCIWFYFDVFRCYVLWCSVFDETWVVVTWCVFVMCCVIDNKYVSTDNSSCVNESWSCDYWWHYCSVNCYCYLQPLCNWYYSIIFDVIRLY